MEAEPSSAIGPVSGRVVLDASVLYPASLRDTLLRAAERGLYSPVWSDLILDEVSRNLVADHRIDESRSSLIAQLRRVFPRAEVRVPENLIEQMTNEAKDRHVLAAAVVARAEVVVTANLRDFRQGALSPYGIVALSPDTFLQRLFDARSELMMAILQAQAADLVDPPLTTMDVLAALALHAPSFVTLVRSVLG
jgi:predicted nucleic acid-binding protein